MPTIAYRLVGDDLVLFLASDAAPSEQEWQAYAQFLTGIAQKVRAAKGTLKFLAFADEGGLNAKQRAAVVEILRGISTLTAVVSSSAIARHVITAFGWLNFAIKGFAPAQLTAAGEYLRLRPGQLDDALRAGLGAAPSLGGVRCLSAAAEANTKA